jgi:transposase
MNDAGSITMTMRALDRLKVIQQVADLNLKPGQAASRLGLTVRQVRRLVRRYEAQGAAGLVSRRCNRPSNRDLDEELAQVALAIVRERYADFGPTLACEKLRELHGIVLSKETIRKLMSAVGCGFPAASVRHGFTSRATAGIALASWFRSMAAPTNGLKTGARRAPCWYTWTMPLASSCSYISPVRNRPSVISRRRVPRSNSTASRRLSIATSTASSASTG